VIAAVTVGIYMGWHTPELTTPIMRMQGISVWEILTFLLNAVLFLLIGMQMPSVLDDLSGDSAGDLVLWALLISFTVVAVRLLWQFTAVYLIRAIDRREVQRMRRSRWQERVVIGWAGMRGAVSLAAALAVPLETDSGAPFPERDLIIFLAFAVILVTLVGQGLTLPALLRALRLQGDRPWTPDEAIARLETAQSALDRLDELEDEGGASEEQLRRMRELYRARFRACQAVLGGGEQDADADVRDTRRRYGDLRRELIGVERAALLGLRNEGKLRPDVQRLIQRDLDLEEARLT
jgi:monovalent cation/hydrogen antiporter